uniref:KDEL motif-containing protein 1-like n=1 Tax=Dermatophagoides pteronyssinus TaxID=6956 RepID=A0A6P6XSU3_DERPT|nr:KDEL motif-containing protein 1-like [Dermatophagoides pteronyssinus]
MNENSVVGNNSLANCCSYDHDTMARNHNLLIVLFLLSIWTIVVNSDHEDIAKIIVVGPGIQNVQLAFPSRYFFILHQIPKLGSVEIRPKKRLNASPVRGCHIWPQVFNQTRFCIRLAFSDLRKSVARLESLNDVLDMANYCDDEQPSNGSENDDQSMATYWMTIVRYSFHRGHWQCDQPLELVIHRENDSQIPIYRRSITNPNKPFYSEHCPCIRNEWSQLSQCDANANQRLHKRIDQDLAPFQSGINFTAILDEAINRFGQHPQAYAFCHYRIKNNKAYKRCYGQYDGFSKFFDRMLLSLMRKTQLSDSQLLMNLGDWPLSHIQDTQPLPIFSWCGSEKTNDIVLPTYELTESVLNGHDRVATDIQSTFGSQFLAFSFKQNRLFWRGRDSNEARLTLIDQSMSTPSHYDVAITNFFFYRDRMTKYRTDNTTTIPYVPFKRFFDYRYQINLDGTVAAYRFPFLLAGNSLVIKQQSQYYEHFYHLFEPGKHYVSVDESLDKLPSLLQNLIEQKDLKPIKRMIWEARMAVIRWLMPSTIYCYYYKALESYSQLLLTQQTPLDESMHLITDDDDLNYYGTCPQGCQQRETFVKDEL